MPLGFEANGIMPGLIQEGGAALSATIQRTGQAIQHSLLQQQAFRQARELGSALTQTDPASDKWPQQAAFLTSQFPLAVASGLAKEIVTPMAKAYAGFQKAKESELILNRQTKLIDERDKVNVNRYNREHPAFVQPGATVGGDGGLMGGAAEPIADVRPGRTAGLAGLGPVGLTAGAAMDAAGAQEQPLPTLPGGEAPPPVDAATGMARARSRAADIVLREEATRAQQGLAPRGKRQGDEDINKIAKSIFDAENKAKPATENKSLEDFAVENGYERIGNSSYFSKNGAGRYQIDTNAKGQHTVKTAGVSSEPEKKAQSIASSFNRAQQQDYKTKLTAAERSVQDAENDWKTAKSALERVRKNETSGDDAALAQFRQLQEAARVAQDALGAARVARNALKEPDALEYFDSIAEAKAAGKQPGDVIIMVNPTTGEPGRARIK